MRLKPSTQTKNLTFYIPDIDNTTERPFVDEGISAGFPSPADDFKENRISLDKSLIKNTEATFYASVRGQSMIGAGMDDGDLLVIDRSLEPRDGKIAVCFIDGEFTVKRLQVSGSAVTLMPENPTYDSITVTEENELVIWGIVTYVIKKV